MRREGAAAGEHSECGVLAMQAQKGRLVDCRASGALLQLQWGGLAAKSNGKAASLYRRLLKAMESIERCCVHGAQCVPYKLNPRLPRSFQAEKLFPQLRAPGLPFLWSSLFLHTHLDPCMQHFALPYLYP